MWWQNLWITLEPWAASGTILLAIAIGLIVAILTGPGVWIMLLAATLVNWLWTPGLYSWWTLGACAALGLLGEVLEMVASAIGSKKFGGSGAGATASVVGGIVGAILGTFMIPIPIAGTIIGSVLGAAGAALLTERKLKGRTWDEAKRSATGALVGRLTATVIKLVVAVAVAFTLIVGLVF